MKSIAILILVSGIMACLIGALLKTNNEAFGKELLLGGLLFTWIGIAMVVYFWIWLKRKK